MTAATATTRVVAEQPPAVLHRPFVTIRAFLSTVLIFFTIVLVAVLIGTFRLMNKNLQPMKSSTAGGSLPPSHLKDGKLMHTCSHCAAEYACRNEKNPHASRVAGFAYSAKSVGAFQYTDVSCPSNQTCCTTQLKSSLKRFCSYSCYTIHRGSRSTKGNII